MRADRRKPTRPAITEVHARLFTDDVETLKRIATQKAVPWQIELRLLVRRAIRGERQEVVVLKEQP